MHALLGSLSPAVLKPPTELQLPPGTTRTTVNRPSDGCLRTRGAPRPPTLTRGLEAVSRVRLAKSPGGNEGHAAGHARARERRCDVSFTFDSRTDLYTKRIQQSSCS